MTKINLIKERETRKLKTDWRDWNRRNSFKKEEEEEEIQLPLHLSVWF